MLLPLTLFTFSFTFIFLILSPLFCECECECECECLRVCACVRVLIPTQRGCDELGKGTYEYRMNVKKYENRESRWKDCGMKRE
ncbi:hypothetical protein F5H01DRAFT_356934 [Linnemannia elongata]|nr:hypothetical protein F5H01DRAFT_356934 [Linnemannia elongata]